MSRKTELRVITNPGLQILDNGNQGSALPHTRFVFQSMQVTGRNSVGVTTTRFSQSERIRMINQRIIF